MNIRKASIEDLDLLIRVRFDYLTKSGGPLSEAERESLTEYMIPYFEQHLEDDTFIAIFAEEEDVIAAVAFLALSDMPASPSFPTGKIGTVLNVLTYEDFRRKGLASQVIERILTEARAQNVRTVRLSATKMGEPLYQKIGFTNAEHQAMTISLPA
ncbi:MAG: GNAT family N-acetyltransferase [Raoultibacter sp.]